jgi:hypothetical protein
MSVQFTEENPHDWDWESDPERWTKHRSRYIERTTDFDSTASEIIAWAELGYSHSGISMYTDVGMSTVKSRMTDIDEQDPTALLTRRPGEIEVESSVGIRGTDLATGGDDDE